jgi:trehalose-phosphatase
MPHDSRRFHLAFEAAIFDLDGVVTRTARIHAAAWKRLFDEYLKERSQIHGEAFVPFDERKDYLAYVDGKPRYEGVRSFLESRAIRLPFGDRHDGPSAPTACGLGNRKDRYFAELLARDGVEVFDSTLALLRSLRTNGVRNGMVTSSRHGREIVRRADLGSLFDVLFDGNDLESRNLKGKPHPDAFIETTRQLGASPERTIIFEDAVSGIEAGRRGRFGLVIGVDRGDNRAALESGGADFVVADLSELTVENLMRRGSARARQPPRALERMSEIQQRLRKKRLVVFLDYDGTLTPIVARPELALLSSEMRAAIRRLARHCTVAVVSGRALADIVSLVGIEELYYAGNHGFEIRGPAGSDLRREIGREHLPALARTRDIIAARIQDVPGAFVEDKTYSLSVHYRQSPDERVPDIERTVDSVLRETPQLRKHPGKKVFEIRPRVEWDKGRAVLWLLEALDLAGEDVLPIYVGDDATDEDAFKALARRGLGFLVSSEARPTAAAYVLKDTDEVRRFFEALAAEAP